MRLFAAGTNYSRDEPSRGKLNPGHQKLSGCRAVPREQENRSRRQDPVPSIDCKVRSFAPDRCDRPHFLRDHLRHFVWQAGMHFHPDSGCRGPCGQEVVPPRRLWLPWGPMGVDVSAACNVVLIGDERAMRAAKRTCASARTHGELSPETAAEVPRPRLSRLRSSSCHGRSPVLVRDDLAEIAANPGEPAPPGNEWIRR